MKFKKLYEEYTSDDLYQELIDYIYEKLLVAVDNLAIVAASDIAEYDPDYCSEEPNNYSMEADNKLRQAAEYFAEFLLKEAPEIIHEDVKGRPSGKESKLSAFLSSDEIHNIMRNTDSFGSFAFYRLLDGMVIETTKTDFYDEIGPYGAVNNNSRYWKVIKNDDGNFEAYEISAPNGKQIGKPFLLKEAPEIIHEDLKEDFDASETIGKLNPGDKFRNRNGVIITIIEPQRDGTIQFKIGDEVRAGSEKSIQRMLYKNNYLREDY